MSRFGWAFVNDVIIGTGSAGTGSAVNGLANSVVVRSGGIVSGATNFIFNNSTGFGQLTGSLGITNNLSVTGSLDSGPFTSTTINATTNINSPSITGSLRSNTGNKFGSSAGDVHQFTGSISAGAVSGTTGQFTTISGSIITGSTLLINDSTINNATISTLYSTTNKTSVLYVTGATNSVISGKSLSSLGSAAHNLTKIDTPPASIENLTTFYIKPDGSKLYAYDSTSPGNELVVLSFTTPWDITTLSTTRDYSSGLNTVPRAASDTVTTGLTFKPDGTKAYILTSTPSQELYETSLSVPWDLTTTSWSKKVTLTGSGGSISGQQGISISEDGRYLFTCSGSSTTAKVIRYVMTTPWSSNTITHTSYTTASLGLSSSVFVSDLAVSNDGKSILILDSTNVLHDYELGTPYELTTVTEKSSVSLDSLTSPKNVSECMFLKPDQTTIYFNSSDSGKFITSLTMASSQVDLVGGIHITGDAKITQNINVYGDATFEDLSGSNAQFRILSASSADINGGTIDNTTIATSDITVGSGKTLNVSAGTLTLNAAQIGADKIAGATFGAGTYSFSGRTISNLGSVTTADINGGTIDATQIGLTSSVEGKFTQLTASTHLSASQIFLGTSGLTASSNIIPITDSLYTLGESGKRWKDIYVSGAVTTATIAATFVTGTTLVSGATGYFNTVNAPTLNGNASSATKLATARTLTIGNTGKTFDGTGPVSWSLTEIGAAQTGSNNTFTGINTFNTNYITGSITGSDAKLTSLTASSADINGGTIDNTKIGETTQESGKFSTLSASSTLQIGGNTTLGTAATSTTINGQTTFNEIVTVNASKTFTAGTVDINGGNIDGTAIGSSIQSTGKFSTLSASSNLDVGGNLTVAGTINLGDTTTDQINVNGDLVVDDASTFAGLATFNGNSILGASSANTATFNAVPIFSNAIRFSPSIYTTTTTLSSTATQNDLSVIILSAASGTPTLTFGNNSALTNLYIVINVGSVAWTLATAGTGFVDNNGASVATWPLLTTNRSVILVNYSNVLYVVGYA